MRNSLLTGALLLLSITSCKKEDAQKTDTITTAQAAFMVSSALATNANGFMSRRNDVTGYAKTLSGTGKGCGVPDIFAAARQDATTSNFDYNYAMGYQYVVNCINNISDNLSSNITYNGSFDAAGLSVMDSGTTELILSDINSAAANYTFNGTYSDGGTYHTTDGTNLSGDYNINFIVTNYQLGKTASNAGTGTFTFTLTGSVKNKNTFSYSGSLVFSSTGTLLTIDNAKYKVNLVTAELTATN